MGFVFGQPNIAAPQADCSQIPQAAAQAVAGAHSLLLSCDPTHGFDRREFDAARGIRGGRRTQSPTYVVAQFVVHYASRRRTVAGIWGLATARRSSGGRSDRARRSHTDGPTAGAGNGT